MQTPAPGHSQLIPLQAGGMHPAPAQAGAGCAPGESVSQLCRLLLLPLPLRLTNGSC